MSEHAPESEAVEAARVPDDPREQIRRNLAEHTCHLHRATPHMAVSDQDDLVIADSGLAHTTGNVVTARFATGVTAERITATARHLAAVARPFNWRVGPGEQASELSRQLLSQGLPITATRTVLLVELGRFGGLGGFPEASVAETPLPDGLSVHVVHDAALLRDFAYVVAAQWDPPSEQVRRFYELAASAALAPDGAVRYLVGYRSGRPVAVAESFAHAGMVGIYNVVTLPTHRHRGYDRALTLTAARAARADGHAAAALPVPSERASRYRRLGFTPLGRVFDHAVNRYTSGASR